MASCCSLRDPPSRLDPTTRSSMGTPPEIGATPQGSGSETRGGRYSHIARAAGAPLMQAITFTWRRTRSAAKPGNVSGTSRRRLKSLLSGIGRKATSSLNPAPSAETPKCKMHHFDYAQPRSVTWVCAGCRQKLHEQPGFSPIVPIQDRLAGVGDRLRPRCDDHKAS
jgi:hypothetical protein